MTIELWKEVVGYTGYTVSDLGRVRSHLRDVTGQLLKPGVHTGGYATVRISLGSHEQYVNLLVHRLVLETFVGPRLSGQVCRHLNGIKLDNRLVNLCWGSAAENMMDALEQGTALVGEKHPRAKLTRKKVEEIRAQLAAGESLVALGQQYGVSDTTISDIKQGITWLSTEQLKTRRRRKNKGL